MTQDSKKISVPEGFGTIVLSRTTGWTYWEIVTQPTWFLDKLGIYMRAESIAEKILNTQAKTKAKKKMSKAPRRR